MGLEVEVLVNERNKKICPMCATAIIKIPGGEIECPTCGWTEEAEIERREDIKVGGKVGDDDEDGDTDTEESSETGGSIRGISVR